MYSVCVFIIDVNDKDCLNTNISDGDEFERKYFDRLVTGSILFCFLFIKLNQSLERKTHTYDFNVPT